MHKYERYLIYPLLIIALFYGMSGGNIIKTVADSRVYEEIVTKKIKVVDDNGNTKIFLGSHPNQPNSNIVALYNNSDQPIALLEATEKDKGIVHLRKGGVKVNNKKGKLVLFSGTMEGFQGGAILGATNKGDLIYSLGPTYNKEYGVRGEIKVQNVSGNRKTIIQDRLIMIEKDGNPKVGMLVNEEGKTYSGSLDK